MLHKSADELADLFAPDGVYEFPLLTPGRPPRYEGREEIRSGFRAAWDGAPVWVDEIRDLVVHQTLDPELIIAEQEAAATVTTSGLSFVIHFLLVIRTRGGLIVHLRHYPDALRVAQALGRLPAVAAALGGQADRSSGGRA
jgi:ketosteroid isomerase-like protein